MISKAKIKKVSFTSHLHSWKDRLLVKNSNCILIIHFHVFFITWFQTPAMWWRARMEELVQWMETTGNVDVQKVIRAISVENEVCCKQWKWKTHDYPLWEWYFHGNYDANHSHPDDTLYMVMQQGVSGIKYFYWVIN